MFTEKAALFKALNSSIDAVEISSEIYFDMLEILPPVDIGFDYFVFQEGEGDRIRFYRSAGRYYANLQSTLICTDDFEAEFLIERSFSGTEMIVKRVWCNGESENKYSEFVGTKGSSIAAIANAVGVTFRQ